MRDPETSRWRTVLRRRPVLTVAVVVVVVGGVGAAGAALAGYVDRGRPVESGARAASMPRAADPTAAVAGSQVTLRWAESKLLGAPVTGYLLTRYLGDDRTGQPATGGCAGLVKALTCVDTDLPDGTYRYAVRAAHGTNATWTGPQSAHPATATVSTIGVVFPVSGGRYGSEQYDAGCGAAHRGTICGNAVVAPGRTVAKVEVTVRALASGKYLAAEPTGGFTSATPVPRRADGGTSWWLPLAASKYPDNGKYLVRATVTDSSGRASSAEVEYTVDPRVATAPPDPAAQQAAANQPGAAADTTAPAVAAIRATNCTGCVAGRIEAGDSLAVEFSEPVAPASIRKDWDGVKVGVVVRFEDGSGATKDRMSVLESDGKTPIAALGSFALPGSDHVTATILVPAKLELVAQRMVMTFEQPAAAAADRPAAAAAGAAATGTGGAGSTATGSTATGTTATGTTVIGPAAPGPAAPGASAPIPGTQTSTTSGVLVWTPGAGANAPRDLVGNALATGQPAAAEPAGNAQVPF